MVKADLKSLSAAQLYDRIADLDARIAALEVEAKPLRAQLGNIDATKAKLTAEKVRHADRLRELNEKPRVSDHAVVRYLERRYGFDFENIRSELLTPAVIGAMNVGAEGVKLDGGTLKIKGRTITTYVANEA